MFRIGVLCVGRLVKNNILHLPLSSVASLNQQCLDLDPFLYLKFFEFLNISLSMNA